MEFAKGIKVKTVRFDNGGEIIKLGINLKQIQENKVEGDWLNVDIKRGRESGEWYQCLNDYKKG